MTTRDQAAIEAAIDAWTEGWAAKDAARAAAAYADDADWTNAFGMSRRGRADIEAFLGEVFALPFVMAGRGRTTAQETRFVGSDVAVVTTRVEREGQLDPSGVPLGTRHISHLRVLRRSERGWEIVSHLISDARDPNG